MMTALLPNVPSQWNFFSTRTDMYYFVKKNCSLFRFIIFESFRSRQEPIWQIEIGVNKPAFFTRVFHDSSAGACETMFFKFGSNSQYFSFEILTPLHFVYISTYTNDLSLSPGDNFNNIIRAVFTTQDPKNTKKTNKLSSFFALLGSSKAKAARKMMVKLTPGGDFCMRVKRTIVFEVDQISSIED